MQTSYVNRRRFWFLCSVVGPRNQYFYFNSWKYFLHLLEFPLTFLAASPWHFCCFLLSFLLNFSATYGSNPFLDGFSIFIHSLDHLIHTRTPKLSLCWWLPKLYPWPSFSINLRDRVPSASMVLPFGRLIGIFLVSVAPESDFEKGFKY